MLEGWVRRALRRSGISQAELSRQLTESLGRSLDRAAINKLVSGARSLAADEMLEIARITGYPAPGPRITTAPLIDWVQAGPLKNAESQIPVEEVPLLAFADLGRGEFFALRVEGDSMDRLSPDGSVIIVNRDERQLVAGRCYVFSVRGETTYKRWHPDPPYLEPFSTNPVHKPIFLRRKSDLEVIGRVRRTVLDL